VTLAAALALLAGCGVNSAKDIDEGYPPAVPKRVPGTSLAVKVAAHRTLRMTVPKGWHVASLSPTENRALVSLEGNCYLSIEVTGSDSRVATASGIRGRYAQPSQGYQWAVKTHADRIVAMLEQSDQSGQRLSRSTLGTMWLPLDPYRYLVVDFGAGIWPLRRRACSDSDVASLVFRLRTTARSVFATAAVQ
jgi:hypothetical protein